MLDYTITVSEIPKILKLYWDTNIPVYLVGPPGIGKSEAVRQFCEELSKKYKRTYIEWFDVYEEDAKNILLHPEKYFLLVDFKLYEQEPQDIKGFLFIDKDQSNVKIIPWDWMKFFYNSNSMGVIFLDELNMAHSEVMKVAFQLIYQRILGNKRIKGRALIVAAGNPPENNYLATNLPIPLYDRMAVYNVNITYEEWIRYANAKNINKYIRQFISLYPNKLLVTEPDSRDIITTPRSWTMLSKILDKINVDKISEYTLYKIVSAHIDESTSKNFVKYVKNYNKYHVTYSNLFKNYINKPEELYNKEDDVDFIVGYIEYVTSKFLEGKIELDKMIDILENIYSIRVEYLIYLFITLIDKATCMNTGKKILLNLLKKIKLLLPGLYDVLLKTNIDTCLTLLQ